MRAGCTILVCVFSAWAFAANAAVVRPIPHAGSVVEAKGDESLRLVDEQIWHPVEVRQDLLGGDTLRVGPFGTLAILFADQTRIRVSRNSTLTIRDVRNGADIGLDAGSIWARSPHQGNVTVRTPAATAAIRGTDWSLSVDPSGLTSLTVLEGSVELRNRLGTILVTSGETAIAEIGKAPAKVHVVKPDDRSQMLFYHTLRDTYGYFPLNEMSRNGARHERQRLRSIPDHQKTSTDWLNFAEIAVSFDGRVVADKALAMAEMMGVRADDRPRADLVRGILLGFSRNYEEAAVTLAQAEMALSGRRKIVAAWMRYFSELLSGRGSEVKQPELQNDPHSFLARSWLLGYLGEFDEALKVLSEGEKRHPDYLILTILRAQIAVLLHRPEMLDQAADRALHLDSNDPLAGFVDGYRRYYVRREHEDALVVLRRSAAVSPGDSNIQNAIGLIEEERGANLEAESAYLAAIAADPDNPVPVGNLAILLLNQHRVKEAREKIDHVLEIDQSFYGGLIALGRHGMQTNNLRRGRTALLEANAANPAAADPLLGLAAVYYEDGKPTLAEQALDTADRLDPNEPIVPLMKSVIAGDHYEADEAILAAREAFQRFRQEGGLNFDVAAQQDGSYLVSAFSMLGLDHWGGFYNEIVFNPFEAGSHFGRATRPITPLMVDQDSSNAVVEASVVQGLALEPLAVSGRERYTDFFRRPFVDGNVNLGMTAVNDRLGYLQEFTIQGFDNANLPLSFYGRGSLSRQNEDRRNDEASFDNFTLGVGANLTPRNRMFAIGSLARQDTEYPGTITAPTLDDWLEQTSWHLTTGFSHTFGYRDALAVTASASFSESNDSGRRMDELFGFPFEITAETESETIAYGGSAAYLRGMGPTILRIGAEHYSVETESRLRQTIRLLDFNIDPITGTSRNEDKLHYSRLFANLSYRVDSNLNIEVGSYFTMINAERDNFRLEPRFGIGWSPAEGHWLRAAYIEETQLPVEATLGPITTVGLQAAAIPLSIGGQVETVVTRWDSEWSPHFFTFLEYQHLRMGDLNFSVPRSIDSFTVAGGEADRILAGFNAWIEDGIGLFGSMSYTWSDSINGDLPFVPDYHGRIGLTWIAPSRLRINLVENFIGDRASERAGERLDNYWTTDLTASWETNDKRLKIELSALNIFDEDYQLAGNIPGASRTFMASIRARF